MRIVFISCEGKSEEKEIIVYSSFEENYISEYIQVFNEEYSEIKINLIRDSSGIIAAKVEAEKIIYKLMYYREWLQLSY